MMQIGMIGLGRMSANVARRLLEGDHQRVVFDRSPKAVEELPQEKAVGASLLAMRFEFGGYIEKPAKK
jgi:6-phosphogluconate dehydrogenase